MQHRKAGLGFGLIPADHIGVRHRAGSDQLALAERGNGLHPVAQLGRALDVDGNSNGQVVIRDSAINEGFNIAQPWAAAVGSGRPFSGNTGSADDKGNLQRNLNDNGFNRMWEYNNRGVGSTVVAEPKQ